MKTGFRSRVLSGFGALVATFLLVVPSIGAQQGGTVTGRVLDSRSGQPVSAAQVFISALDVGGLTQQNGRYLLQNVPAGTHTLSVARIGYRTEEAQVSVGGGQTVEQNFGLDEEALALDEIIVTGTPGGTQRRAIGNSVVSINASDIVAVAPVSNMQELLSGRTPGLQFTRRTGNVGSGSGIRIRGIGSFALHTNPLIYIDGIRVNNSTNAGPRVEDGGFEGLGSSPSAQNKGTTSVLDDLNPDDIESIEIIKGPAAGTLYGTEASAGVIQIITKRGAQGDVQISASIRSGFNFMTDPAGRLGTMYGCSSTQTTPCPVGDVISYNMYDEANRYISGEEPGPDGGRYFDWPTKNLYQYGLIQSYNMDVRGGTQTFRYFASANYDNEEGIEWYNKDKTARLRANLSITPGGNWSMDLSTGYVQGDTRYAAPVLNQGSPWQDMAWSNGFSLARINPWGTANANPRLGGFQEHLPDDIAKIDTTRDYSRFTGGLTLNYNLGDWLSQRLIVGLDRGWDINQVYFPVETVRSTVYSQTIKGEISRSNPITTNISLDYAITNTYDWEEKGLNFQTSVGGQYYIKMFEEADIIARAFASPTGSTINQTDVQQATLNFSFIESRSLGFYVQEQIGLNDRLFVTGAVRFDDHSAFGADFEALVYPKVSATWVVSEENFWGVDYINSLRLRSAWGQAGRQPDVFAKTDVYGVFPGVGGLSGITPVSPGNPEVGPEVSTEIEVGFDVALMDSRISAEFTYFTQKNEDALLEQEIAPNSGFPGAIQKNVGRIDNWGWEALLTAQIYEADSWSFDLRLNGDHVNNEVKDLGTTPSTTTIREGWSYPVHTGRYFVESADPSASGAPGTFSNAMCDSGTGGEPGEAQWPGGELVPCGTISGDTRLLKGRAFYTYKWGIAPSINMFNNTLQLFALAEGAYGREGVDNVLEWGHRYNNTLLSQTEDSPLYVAADDANFQDDRKKENYDADFWTLREIGFRYTIPQSWLAGADRATFSLSARNVAFIWRAQTTIFGGQVGDPELGSVENITGASNFRASPPTASISATLRVSF